MTADELRRRERKYRTAALRAGQALDVRNNGVHEALNDGWTHAQVAEATGLTRSRVGQIATKGQIER